MPKGVYPWKIRKGVTKGGCGGGQGRTIASQKNENLSLNEKEERPGIYSDLQIVGDNLQGRGNALPGGQSTGKKRAQTGNVPSILSTPGV